MDIGLKIALAAFAVYALVILVASHGFWSRVGNLILGAVFGAFMYGIAGLVVGIPVLIYLGLSRQGDKHELALVVQGAVAAISLLVLVWWFLKDAAESAKGRTSRTPHISETNPTAWARREYFQSHRDEFSGYSSDDLDEYLNGK